MSNFGKCERHEKKSRKILNSLTQHSSDLEYKFERLYRILFNEQMYYIAYQRIYAKQGNMTKGVDGKPLTASISHIERLIDTLKKMRRTSLNPLSEVYIPKKTER